MAKQLTDYLRTIGLEIHDTAYMDNTGTLRPITKDEQLAREVFKRALGFTERIVNDDGSVNLRVHAPDPKAQQFIFERREGKFVTPTEDRQTTLLEKIKEISVRGLNKAAEQIVDDRDNSQTDS